MAKHTLTKAMTKVFLLMFLLSLLWGCSLPPRGSLAPGNQDQTGETEQAQTEEQTQGDSQDEPSTPVDGNEPGENGDKEQADATDKTQELVKLQTETGNPPAPQQVREESKIRLDPLPDSTAEKSVEISGTTTPGYKIYMDGAAVPVDAKGAFQRTVDLQSGKNVVTVSAADQTGIVESKDVAITYDPPPPTLLVVAPEESLTEYVTISGTTEYQSIVYVNDKKATPDKKGNFTSSVALKPGSNTIRVTSTNSLGGTAAVTKQIAFQPQAPKLVLVVPASTRSQPLNLTGFTEEDATIIIFANEVQAQVTNKDGVFTAAVPLQRGLNPIWIEAANKWGQRTRQEHVISYHPADEN